MLRPIGFQKSIKLKNSSGTIIDPATNNKLEELKTILQSILSGMSEVEVNTDDLEAQVQVIINQLDVALSTRASELTVSAIKGVLDNSKIVLDSINTNLGFLATETTLNDIKTYLNTLNTIVATDDNLESILNAIGEESGNNLLLTLSNIKDGLNVNLSTRASEATLIEIRNYVDTVETKIQSLIDKNQAQETGGNLDNIKSNTDKLDVNLSTVATENSIIEIKTKLDNLLTELELKTNETTLLGIQTSLNNVITKIDTIISSFDVLLSTRASEATLQEINDNIGQESGTNLISKLTDIWNKLVELFENGIAKIKIWDGTNITTIDNKTTTAKGLNTLTLGRVIDGYYPEYENQPELNANEVNPFLLNPDGIPEFRGSVLTDELSFDDHFPGTEICDCWTVVEGTGASISVANSLLTINAGTEANSETYIVNEMDYLPLKANFLSFTISQRIANQEIYLEFSDNPDPNLQTKYMVFKFDGTDDTKVKCITQSSIDSGANEEDEITIDSTSEISNFGFNLTMDKGVFLYGLDYPTIRELVTHWLHIPSQYDVMYVRIRVKNGSIAPVSNTAITLHAIRVMNTHRLDVKNDYFGDPNLSLIMGFDGTELQKIKSSGDGKLEISIPPDSEHKSIQVLFDYLHTSVNSGEYQEVLEYQIPTGYDLSCISLSAKSSVANEGARVIYKENLGSFIGATNTFTDGYFYSSPIFASQMFLYVTTQIGSGTNDIITVTYTNQDGITGRTSTVILTKNSAVGTRVICPLQTGDVGVTDVTNVTHSATGQAGDFNIEGTQELFSLSLTSSNVQYQSVAVPLHGIIIPEEKTIYLQYFSASAVNNRRRLNLMGTLIER